MAKKSKARSSSRRAKKKVSAKASRRTAKSAKRAPARRKAASRRPNAAFMRPVTPSAALGDVVGHRPMPRTEVTKKLWEYIKKNGLQDQRNRRMIRADDKLRLVFGKPQVNMFEMTRLVERQIKHGGGGGH